MQKNKFNVKLFVLLPLVLAITIFLWVVPTSFYGIEFLTATQQRVIALFVFAALMWMFEIIPNWTTSLLIIVFSLLIVSDKGIGFLCTPDAGQLVPYKSIMSAFADPVVMLFLGGFVLANMATKYGLDVTLARFLLKPFKKSWSVLLAFLVVIALFSMFMSNTATAAMMLALLTPVLRGLPDDDKGKVGLALSIPVAANVGGIGTTIGTPPNATAVKFLGEAGFDVTFASWAAHMIPYVLVMIIVAWVILMILFPFKTKELRLDIKPSSRKTDWKTIVVWVTFFGTILLWATEQITHISSNVVALIPLGVSMQLPEGYEARTAPRSSTFKRWGILQANSVGVIDNSYCGTNDEWKLPVYATRDTVIEKGDRICQFRIYEVQPPVSFEECDTLSDTDRGGFGSTGVR